MQPPPQPLHSVNQFDPHASAHIHTIHDFVLLAVGGHAPDRHTSVSAPEEATTAAVEDAAIVAFGHGGGGGAGGRGNGGDVATAGGGGSGGGGDGIRSCGSVCGSGSLASGVGGGGKGIAGCSSDGVVIGGEDVSAVHEVFVVFALFVGARLAVLVAGNVRVLELLLVTVRVFLHPVLVAQERVIAAPVSLHAFLPCFPSDNILPVWRQGKEPRGEGI
mmetsp:Transcript_35693/g.87838  ORF Transcript_35693/g.87838 Transcript_35693/m.87838 type:complete len:218 (-) Transcript_35693:598-1251(-)